MGDLSTKLDQDSVLLDKLNLWVNERSIPKSETLKHPLLYIQLFFERRRRKQILKAINKDLQTENSSIPFTVELLSQKEARVGANPIIAPYKDALTGISIYQILRREGEYLIAEERSSLDLSSDNNIITQARLDPQGHTYLTLHSERGRYQTKETDLHIVRSDRFPNGTLQLFEMLSKSVEESLRD